MDKYEDNSYGKIMGDEIRKKYNKLSEKERKGRLFDALTIVYSKKDKSIIPEGPYCYSRDKNNKITKCPYYGRRNCDGVEIPWCFFLEAGGYPNDNKGYAGWEDSDKAIKTLEKYFGEKYEESTDLFLLFDMVKECGINYNKDEDENKERISYLPRVRTNIS